MRKLSRVLILAVIGTLFSAWATVAKPESGLSSYENAPGSVPDSGINAQADHSETRSTVRGDTYYFTMMMPEQAGRQYEKLSLSFNKPKPDGGVAVIPFNLLKTKAFIGTPDTIGRAIAIKNAWVDETGILWVEFDRSIKSKITLTVALTPRTPPAPGSYEYGIAAYPETKTPAVLVGNGILTINK